MALNTKNTERELKIQKTWEFVVKYKKREKKYKKQLLRSLPTSADPPRGRRIDWESNVPRRLSTVQAPVPRGPPAQPAIQLRIKL